MEVALTDPIRVSPVTVLATSLQQMTLGQRSAKAWVYTPTATTVTRVGNKYASTGIVCQALGLQTLHVHPHSSCQFPSSSL